MPEEMTSISLCSLLIPPSFLAGSLPALFFEKMILTLNGKSKYVHRIRIDANQSSLTDGREVDGPGPFKNAGISWSLSYA